MRKVVLYIAMSLDGYIADEHGNVDWLNGQDMSVENMDTYSVFVQYVDTVIMGWDTYEQIATKLSPTEWVYANLTSYVVTHRKITSPNSIIFTEKAPSNLVKELRAKEGKDIWLCGGANIVQQLIQTDLIDEYYISVIPTILGSGIRLFGTAPDEIKLKLISTQAYNGIVELVYARR